MFLIVNSHFKTSLEPRKLDLYRYCVIGSVSSRCGQQAVGINEKPDLGTAWRSTREEARYSNVPLLSPISVAI